MALMYLHILCVMAFLTDKTMNDEHNCQCHDNPLSKAPCNFSVMETHIPKLCSPLHQLKHGKCQPHYSKSDVGHISSITLYFECQNGQMIDQILLDDLFVDCLPQEDDKPLLLSVPESTEYFLL